MAFVEFSRRAPTGFLIVPDDGDADDDNQTTLIQSDWDYPGVARSMGWGGEDNQISEALEWIEAHEGEEFEGLDDYLSQENPVGFRYQVNLFSHESLPGGKRSHWYSEGTHKANDLGTAKEMAEHYAAEGDQLSYTIVDLSEDKLAGWGGPGMTQDTAVMVSPGSRPGYKVKRNPCMSNPGGGTADSWNAGLEAGKKAQREGYPRDSYSRMWAEFRERLTGMGYRQHDMDNARRNFVHAFSLAYGDRSPQLAYAGAMPNPEHNGRSYAVRGIRPPMGWTPYPGAVVYIEGVRTTLGKPTHGEGQTMYPLRPPVHGTTAMGGRNILQVAYVPEGETVRPGGASNPAGDSPTREWEDFAFDAGKQWGSTGAHESGVSNANVRHYGFVKWWNNLTPHTARQVRKSVLERAFNEGYAIGKGTGRTGNPQTGVDRPMSWDLASFARSKYSRRAQHIKAVTDYLIKLRDEGNYNLKSATKAYYYVIEGAAKEYGKEYGTKPPSPTVKMEAARDLMSMVEGGR
jgi:hypothetical protein